MSHIFVAIRDLLGIWCRNAAIVCFTLIIKIMEYSSMSAPIYASWGIELDTYYGKKYLINDISPKVL